MRVWNVQALEMPSACYFMICPYLSCRSAEKEGRQLTTGRGTRRVRAGLATTLNVLDQL